ncbi:MAG: hypothetical protein JSV46_10345 [Candidatus Aminicenantes bacterium]|nr:MAG: hypothetical protein JSV46_10345 [Candidatus Aminicenantes bacterium]
MNMRKTVTLLGLLLILCSGIILAQEQKEQSKAQVRKEEQKVVQNQVQTKVEERERVRRMFVDENGDGISDFARDHDNDGIPNCQDPDWTPPEDGSGYMYRYRNASEANRFEYRNRLYNGEGWNRASFRQCFSHVTRSAQGRSSQKGKTSNRRGR